MSKHTTVSQFHKPKTLNDKYLLGDEIGKGAYGRVYKSLDLENGDFVAIKQVSLENIPAEDLASIMLEIDLLKNLNHKNIVKYQGSFKTKTHLYIILEYVENGSLASIIKPNKFGAFPESLVAVYIAQVLEGLAYLHEQGVIHRDIKGANILTTKEGLVKLADFGVATKLTEADLNTHSVVGTPYWMAPEVIEMSGVSAASDIWSVGCTVIELLTCVPPYYDLQPMPALFRIVQDDHPPIPEHLSAGITDFLHQCFRKDAKLRPDAKTLLKHSWIRNSRRAFQNTFQRTGGRMSNIPQDVSTVVERTIEDGQKDDQRAPVQEDLTSKDLVKSGNNAQDDDNIKGLVPIAPTEASGEIPVGIHNAGHGTVESPPDRISVEAGANISAHKVSEQLDTFQSQSAGTSKPDCKNSTILAEELKPDRDTPKSLKRSQNVEEHLDYDASLVEQISKVNGVMDETGSLLPQRAEVVCSSNKQEQAEISAAVQITNQNTQRDHKLFVADSNDHQFTLQAGKSTPSTQELSKFSDTPADGTLDDLFEESIATNHRSRIEGKAFAAVLKSHTNDSISPSESKSSSLAAKLKAKIAQKKVEDEVALGKRNGGNLFSAMISAVEDAELESNGLVFESAEGRQYYATQAMEVTRLIGLLKPEESEEAIITACQKLISMFCESPEQKSHLANQHGVMPLLEMLEVNNNRLINQIIKDSADIQQNACLVGMIPAIMHFAAPERSREIRIQAAYFIQQMCSSVQTLQMFIACRGLPVLVSFLEPDYAKYREMVHIAIDCMWQIFELRSSTPRKDFCRIFAKSGVLVRLVNTLHSLNEATRLASAMAVGTDQQSRSGPLDHFRPFSVLIETLNQRSGQLDSSRLCSGHADNSRQPTGFLESPKTRLVPGLKPFTGQAEYPRQTLGGEYSRPISGPLEISKVTTSADHPRRNTTPQERLQLTATENTRSSLTQAEHARTVVREQLQQLHTDYAQHHIDGEQSKGYSANSEIVQKPTDRASLHDVSGTSNGPADAVFEQVPKLLALAENEPLSKPFSGHLDHPRYYPSATERTESSLPLLHHSSAIRKVNGELDILLAAFAEKNDIGVLELIQEASSSKTGTNMIEVAIASKLMPSASSQNYGVLHGSEGTSSGSGLVSQSASGLLSVSGVLNGRPGSAASSGLLSQMVSSLNTEIAREYLAKAADLLVEFSRADTFVKSHMCTLSLLIRLFTMLNKLEHPILVKILKCIEQLSMEPCTLELLQRADAMKHLIPLLESREGLYVSQIHSQVLNALYNLCKINKRRQDQAAECGIIPLLMHFITTNSPLKQVALPLLCDMAHASRYTREQLRLHKGLELFLSLLDDEYWAFTALDSLAVCLAHDNEHRKIEQALLKHDAVQKLVGFFQSCSGPSFVHILEPFLKIINKSARLNTALAVSGLTPLLVGRLDHQDAIARLNLLKLIKAVYEHHPRPKQLIVEHDLPSKLQKLIEERRDGEHSGGQVLVKQMATALLKALHINTVL
ncbi:hypothetical protein O6H91_11G119200 [Diphasiastrum complanatum]|uniref:Uncharacterized protein n=2 Tax=Diphasiastrum complanatum TaxID=34168 RepID=A0ACC2CDE1_DIPCM|nr:hypothetical protein O6H91_11G119200 [Diphasiastrum complanatum]KAJ7540033.1 hypothetical protein O6H91_11G119200 [Diphasiastrum complanatum]